MEKNPKVVGTNLCGEDDMKKYKVVFLDCGVPNDIVDYNRNIVLYSRWRDAAAAAKTANQNRMDVHNTKYIVKEVDTI